jgi:hypothetical protein
VLTLSAPEIWVCLTCISQSVAGEFFHGWLPTLYFNAEGYILSKSVRSYLYLLIVRIIFALAMHIIILSMHYKQKLCFTWKRMKYDLN